MKKVQNRFARVTGLSLVLALSPCLIPSAGADDEVGSVSRTIKIHPVPDNPVLAGTALLQAMANITTASTTNPWLIKLDAGIFDLGAATLAMKPYVDIEGSGEDVTRITSAAAGFSSTNLATMTGASHAEFRGLTVANTGGLDSAVFFAAADSLKLTRVTVDASSGDKGIVIATTSGQTLLTDVRVIAVSYGITIFSSSQGSAGLRGVQITAPFGVRVAGIGGGTVRIDNARIEASSGGIVVNTFAPVFVDRSNIGAGIEIVTIGPLRPLAFISVGTSQVSGTVLDLDNGMVMTPPRITCVGDYNFQYAPLNLNCQ